MLWLYQSNNLESLSARLAALLTEPVSGPLRREPVIVQHPGMARWLSLRIADHLGICSNLSFPLPAAFIWQLFHNLLPEVPDCDRYQPKRLAWRIYLMLRESEENRSQRPIDEYLADADEVKRFQFAQQLATLFDRYLIYRPDWIVKWQQGEAAVEGDEWQANLWRRLSADDAVHWVSLRLQLGRLADEALHRSLPPRLFMFGVPTLSPGYLEIIRHIASLTEVHLFLLNPCRTHWADILSPAEQAKLSLRSEQEALYLEVGNPLLATMGRQGRDFFAAVNEMDPGGEELFEESPDDSLLHRLQNQILTLSEPLPADVVDASISLHRCHSPMREVEVLYDQLLAALDDIPGLKASDILVMTPDIDRYAPLIKALFDTPGSRPRIPFRTSGTALLRGNPLAMALLELLQLRDSRYGVGDMLNLLELPAIRRRFSLHGGGLEQATQWLIAAGVRWGRDGESKQSLGLPCEESNTWQAGLRQLMLGYAMPAKQQRLWRQTYPLDAVEGSECQWLGGLLAFCDAVFAIQDELAVERSAQAWLTYLIGLTERFFVPDEASELQLESLRETIHGLVQELQEAGIGQQLSIAVIRHRLHELLSLPMQRGFLGGGVTCCALAPMRSLPFRVIALIGMNDDLFPRQQPALGFDLMAKEFRLGDRSRRADDRYLFLETLISARDRLLISYVGRSQRDNQPMPPSVVVDELSDTLRQMVGEAGMERITFDHPLQPFSRNYYLADSRLFSYSAEMREAAWRVGSGSRLDAPLLANPLPGREEDGVIDLQRLLSFFANPQRALAEIRLNIELEQTEQLPEEREQFALDYFDQTELEHELVEDLLSGEDAERLRQRLRTRGRLPQGKVGEQTFSQMQGRAAAMVRRIQSFDGGRTPDSLDVDLLLGEQRLTGHLRGLSPDGLLAYTTDRFYPHLLLKHWIRHLLLNAIAVPGVAPLTRLLEGERTGRYRAVDRPVGYLERLVEYYRQGLLAPLAFYPATAWSYQELLQQGGEERAAKAAQQRWSGGRMRLGDLDKPYQRLFWPNRPVLDGRFFETGSDILQPLMDHLEWQ
jgi:exodeoxyribonuclease V gamma subunit